MVYNKKEIYPDTSYQCFHEVDAMLLLKANPELQKVFEKLIKTMKVPVTWNNVLVISNNCLILAGDVRSLIFNFDNKKSYTSILELPEESIRLQSMPADYILNNIMNMALYAFGKWGVISGLKVDKDYDALNALFADALRPVGIEPEFGRENFRFFQGGIQITYEDTALAILRLLRQEGKLKEGQSLVTSDTQNDHESPDPGNNNPRTDGQDMSDLDEDYYKLGLWHNMCWKRGTDDFKRAALTNADSTKSRIGNNFYQTNYLCPKCNEKLYMGVFPAGKEMLIETDEGRVFMARAYACNTCNQFYTPCPGKLIQEGDVYGLKFDEDRTAFEDYLDILGRGAERTSNSNFNEFESDRNRSKAKALQKNPEKKNLKEHLSERIRAGAQKRTPETVETSKRRIDADQADPKTADIITTKIDVKPDKTAVPAPRENPRAQIPAAPAKKTIPVEAAPPVRKTDPAENTAPARKTVPAENATPAKKTVPAESASPAKKTIPAEPVPPTKEAVPVETAPPQPDPVPAAFRLAGKTTDELRAILSGLSRKQEPVSPAQAENDARYRKVVEEVLAEKLTAKYDARVRTLNNLSSKQLSDLKAQIEKEAVLSEEKKKPYIQKINGRLFQEEEKALSQKVELCKNRSYAEIGRMIEDIEKRSLPEELKQETVRKLKQFQEERAGQEVAQLIEHLPLHLDRKQLAAYLDKINQYQGVDITPYRKQLEQRKDMAEKEEITAMIRRGGRKERNALWNLYEQIQKQDFKEENKAPFLEKIYAKVKEMDEERIEQLCPSIVTLSYTDALKAYDRISQGVFLPELKVNTLEMIKRRLTRLKTDESVQLMRKLKHDLEESLPHHYVFYYYNAREEMNRTPESSANSSVQADLYGKDEELEAENNREAMLCAINSYAAQRGEYEYPLMVCDTSRNQTGKEGFVLTPDHIFYHTLLHSGVINIADIEEIRSDRKLFAKGVYAKYFDGSKEKIPNHIAAKDWSAFATVLYDFIIYLQERPESRSLEYMAKETHDVKCCYRCGFVYKTGNVCPKCGSKMNR